MAVARLPMVAMEVIQFLVLLLLLAAVVEAIQLRVMQVVLAVELEDWAVLLAG
jgi:hypothetical protein